MTQFLRSLLAAAVLTGVSAGAAHADIRAFSSKVLPNRANQVVAGFPASGADWTIRNGRVQLFAIGGDHFLLTLRVRGLIIPFLGFNPSGDLLARIVCHDESGQPFVADTTRASTNFTPEGDGVLFDRVEIPDACFAPIVLIGGSVGPMGEEPSNWFAISGF
jgi:hypothetical protein